MSLKKIVLTLILSLTFSVVLFSQSNENYMASGIKYYQEGNYIDSIYFFNRIIDQDNELFSEALFWKSKAFYGLEYYNDAKKNLELFFTKADLSTAYYEDARFLYCKVYFKLDRFQDALFLFNQFYRTDSFKFYKVSSKFWIGECYLQLSELEEAKKAFTVYLGLKPDSENAKERIKLINNMLSIIQKENSSELAADSKAEWFVEYIVNEDISKGDITLTALVDSFDSKNDFFIWLDKLIISANAKKEIIKEESLDSKIINEKKLDDIIEKAPVSVEDSESSEVSKLKLNTGETLDDSGADNVDSLKVESDTVSTALEESENIDLDLLEILISNEMESRLRDKVEVED